VWQESLSNALHAGKNSRAINNVKPLPCGVYMLRMSVQRTSGGAWQRFTAKLSVL
jgi:hypothetical protein